MLNLLKSDFYRLFKSKSFYICTIVYTILRIASAVIMEFTVRLIANNANVTTVPGSVLKDGISYGLTSFTQGGANLYIAIFVAIFITADFTHGTMKNVVSKGFSKLQVYLSKIVTMMAVTYLMLLTSFIFSTITATILTGKFGTFTLTYVGQIFQVIGIELLLYAALVAVFTMIAMVVRNAGGTIAINIVGIVMVGPVIFQVLELFVKKIHFTDYELSQNIISFINLTPNSEDVIRAIIIGLAYFVVTTGVGILAFTKSDVK